jgi:hypothetical protein
MRNLYTENEIIVCAYIARFGRNDFKESDVVRTKNRSLSSIKMKVQNIAAMLDEEGFEYSDEVSRLTGLPAGQKGRRTNWDIVRLYAKTPKTNHYKKCVTILS